MHNTHTPLLTEPVQNLDGHFRLYPFRQSHWVTLSNEAGEILVLEGVL